MGAEVRDVLMPPLVELARGTVPIVKPMPGGPAAFGPGGANKVWARAAGQYAARNPGSADRMRRIFDEMDERGHTSIRGGCDVFSGSHWQIVGGAEMATLKVALRDGHTDIADRAIRYIRVETAAMRDCRYTVTRADDPTRGRVGELMVLTPGSRARDMRKVGGVGSKGVRRQLVPVLNNSSRNLCARLMAGAAKVHVGADPQFNVAALLLMGMLSAGEVTRKELQGDDEDLAMLAKYGWKYEGTSGDYTASFNTLPGADNPLWGVRVRDGEVELDWRE